MAKGRFSSIDRRGFARIALASVVLPLVGSCADSDRKMRRIGVLTSAPPDQDAFEGFAAALREFGWIEGGNIVLERRFTNGRIDLLPLAAEELVRLKVDLIVTDGTPATLAAKNATMTIPIVMGSAGDPVVMGIVSSLARPGGNVTGYSVVSPELATKRAALLHELLPAVGRVAMAIQPGNPVSSLAASASDAALRSVGVRVIFIDPTSVESVIAEAVRQGAQAALIPPLGADAAMFMERATRYRLPVISQGREMAEAGALLCFDINTDDIDRRVAAIIDKVLRGTKPADIPIEQPTKFDLFINQKAATALGITVPQSLLLRADVVIR